MELVNIKAFIDALCSNPDLNCMPTIEQLLIIQDVYAATGCDYTLFYWASKNAMPTCYIYC